MKTPPFSQFFEAVPLNEHIMQILGQGGELCYLIEGSKRAVLIDGLVGAGPLRPYIRELTDLPVTLILTHGHLDHIGAAWEYGSCYIHPDDIPLMYSKRHSSPQSRYDFARMKSELTTHQTDSLSLSDITPPVPVITRPLYDGDIIDCGDLSLEVIGVPGHTFGTLVFLDRKDRIVFSGDACNINTLLGMTGCAPIEVYLDSLLHLKSFENEYDVMYGGHGRNAVPRSIVDDAIAMCERILAGTDDAEPAVSMDGTPVFYGSAHLPTYMPACGGLANIQYSRDNLYRSQAKKYRCEDDFIQQKNNLK